MAWNTPTQRSISLSSRKDAVNRIKFIINKNSLTHKYGHVLADKTYFSLSPKIYIELIVDIGIKQQLVMLGTSNLNLVWIYLNLIMARNSVLLKQD